MHCQNRPSVWPTAPSRFRDSHSQSAKPCRFGLVRHRRKLSLALQASLDGLCGAVCEFHSTPNPDKTKAELALCGQLWARCRGSRVFPPLPGVWGQMRISRTAGAGRRPAAVRQCACGRRTPCPSADARPGRSVCANPASPLAAVPDPAPRPAPARGSYPFYATPTKRRCV
jgi:hypothetical protein